MNTWDFSVINVQQFLKAVHLESLRRPWTFTSVTFYFIFKDFLTDAKVMLNPVFIQVS